MPNDGDSATGDSTTRCRADGGHESQHGGGDANSSEAVFRDALAVCHQLVLTPSMAVLTGLARSVFRWDGTREEAAAAVDRLADDGWLDREPTPQAATDAVVLATDGPCIVPEPDAVGTLGDTVTPNAAAVKGWMERGLPDALPDGTTTVTVDERWAWRVTLPYEVAVRLRYVEHVAGGPPPTRRSPTTDAAEREGRTAPLVAPAEERITTYARRWDDDPVGPRLDDLFDWVREPGAADHVLRTLYARYLLAEGRLDDAAAELDAVIESAASPHPVARGYRSVVALAHGHGSEALEQGRPLLTATDGLFGRTDDQEWGLDPDLLVEYAHRLLELGEPATALDTLRSVATADTPQSLTAIDYAVWGRALAATDHPDEAAAKFETALDRDSDCVEALVGRGRLRAGRDDHEAALAALKRAVELAPGHVEAAVELAALYRRADRWDDVRATLEAALDERPEAPVLWLRQAGLERHDANPSAAADAYERAIDHLPAEERPRVRQEYVNFIYTGLVDEDPPTEGVDQPIRRYPTPQRERARPHLEAEYDRLRPVVADAGLGGDEDDLSVFVDTAERLVRIETATDHPETGRDRAEDALAALPRRRPERGVVAYTPLEADVLPKRLGADIWTRQACAYMLLINREYEAAARVIEPLWEQRADVAADNSHYANFLNCIRLYAGCVTLGHAEGDAMAVARWVRAAGDKPSLTRLVTKHLFDDPVEDTPFVLYYNADVHPRAVARVPTEATATEHDLSDLHFLATAVVFEELYRATADSPFDPETAELLDRRPAPGDDPALYELDGIGPQTDLDLRRAGVQTKADLRRVDADDLTHVDGIGSATAEKILGSLDAAEPS